ncbi:MAG: inositol monophosphatase family protein [Candidatus Promineifilaceae bacterium]|nr:inositol monophosphatase family protein [Candidatus Promineifilaceae bacterium]
MESIKLLHIAEEAALAAGKLAREQFGEPHRVMVKGFRDLVTDTDLKAQEIITNTIRDEFPDHGFMTEEEDFTLAHNGEVIWIIDPIDGTTNFSRNLPIFSISIAAISSVKPMDETKILAGVIYDPLRDELFGSESGGISQLNGQAIGVSRTADMSAAQIAYDWDRAGHLRQITLSHVNYFSRKVDSMRSLGSAALALAWVAAGRLDGYFNYSVKPWDLAAASLIIQQAGGLLSTTTGNPLDFSSVEQMNCLASNDKLHALLIKSLARY